METIKIIFSNYYINVAFFSWLAAQVLKVLLHYAFQGKSDFSLLLKSSPVEKGGKL